ncbi:MAG: extracellular solute-binding protein [Phycisphaerales bacterium]|nr:MAG: extracellular solute-binding protein [Phycisphaerales bacterium]
MIHHSHQGRTRVWLLPFIALVVAAAAFVKLHSTDGDSNRVVLYTSIDTPIAKPIIQAFEAKSGLRVDVVGDTEVTKTTGLIERLLAERGRPKADVFWSSEPLGVIGLAREGLLESWTPPGDADSAVTRFSDPQNRWHGRSLRARVIVVNTRRVAESERPGTLRDLLDPKYMGLIGMARPEFGTTRLHVASLLAAWGEPEYRAWCQAMRDQDIRLYDGNSAVVRGVAHGEIVMGLTDTDDVVAGQREGWPVDLIFESVEDDVSELTSNQGHAFRSLGPITIPCTVGRLKGAPHADAGAQLAAFLLSPEVESMLSSSDSKNRPILGEASHDPMQAQIPLVSPVAFDEAEAQAISAVRIFREIVEGSTGR